MLRSSKHDLQTPPLVALYQYDRVNHISRNVDSEPPCQRH
jgi:hypothetical protein